MSRVYFNGVGNVSFNGTLLSFVLDDTNKNNNSSVNKDAVVGLITELDSAEGIFNFLLDEIKKIKEFQETSLNRLNAVDEKEVVKGRPPSGMKIMMSGHDHSE